MKKLTALVLTLAMLASVLAGCSSTSSTDSSSSTASSSSSSASSSSTSSEASTSSSESAEEAEVVDSSAEPVGIVAGTSIDFYSPYDCVTTLMPGQQPTAQYIYPLMYDTLWYAPDGNYENGLEGLLVEDWTVSDDGCVWVLNLHEDVYFHNGTNMTADHVVRCFDLFLKHNNSAAVGAMESYEATDEYQVTITYATPTPETMYQLAVVHCGIFDPTLVEEQGVTAEAFQMAGTGPYYLSDSAAGDYMTFTAFEDYWNPDRMAHIETLNCKVILDTNTQVTALLSGECDYGSISSYDCYENLAGASNLTSEQFYGDTYTIWFNVTSESMVLNDSTVREAIRYLINMDEVALAGTGGYGWANTNAFGAGIDYDDGTVYDPDKGLAMLEEAGVDPSTIVITPVVEVSTSGLFSNIQAQLAEYGIDMQYSVQDSPAATTAMWAGEWDMVAASGGINRYAFASPITMLLGEFGAHNVCRDPDLDPLVWELVYEAFGTSSRDVEIEALTEIVVLLDEYNAYLGSVQVPKWNVCNDTIANMVIDQYNGVWLPWYSWVV